MPVSHFLFGEKMAGSTQKILAGGSSGTVAITWAEDSVEKTIDRFADGKPCDDTWLNFKNPVTKVTGHADQNNDKHSSIGPMTPETSSTHNRAVVIGGGISGLASAALLAKQGWQVTLVEKNKKLGGRARVLKTKGFSFDMGPSWYLMPEIFDQFFAEFGKKSQDFYDLIQLNPRYKVFYGNKQSITLTSDLAQNASVFEALEKNAGRKLLHYLAGIKPMYQAVTKHLLIQDIWRLQTWLNLTNWKAIFSLLTSIRIWESWQSQLNRMFRHPLITQILGFSAVFLGGSPFNTPSFYSLLVWSDFAGGVWYPKGGMIKLVDALEQICRSQGVTILTNQEATQIDVKNGQVQGVKTSTAFLPARIVVGAADLPWIETKLLAPEYQSYPESYWESKTLGISCLLIYLGTKKRYPQLAHHNFYFSDDWSQNFQEIFDQQSLPKDPSLYVSVRSITDSTIAPKDTEEMMILVPIAAKEYTSTALEKYTEKIISVVEQKLDISIKKNILVKHIFTPKDFSQDYNAYQGTALGLAHTLRQSLWGRPDNRSKKVQGLYYAGQYTNPGVGVPMALVSAQLVAKMIGAAPNNNQAIFKKGSTTYYHSSLFFQGQAKEDVFTLYAYVRTVDDLVDRPDPQLTQLDEMWQATQDAWQGKATENPMVKQFIDLAQRKSFKWEWIESFWRAMRSDLQKKTYTSLQDLDIYMYGSAEVIGLMMVQILDLPPQAMKTAALQGKAMQLLNFIRDVGEDADLGRKYLQYSNSWRNNPDQWNTMMRTYINEYYRLQAEAEKGYKYIPKKYLIPIKTAANMYKQTAHIIEQNPMIVWEKKVKPKRWQVLLELMKNALFL